MWQKWIRHYAVFWGLQVMTGWSNLDVKEFTIKLLLIIEDLQFGKKKITHNFPQKQPLQIFWRTSFESFCCASSIIFSVGQSDMDKLMWHLQFGKK